uniref:Large ribosomal subunit protein uL15m n=1 Tax=Plectus sambesii TaxID=2011161 RepID=A0A914VF29_9BILA
MGSKSATERALNYLRRAPRVTLTDVRDNPGARTKGRLVRKKDNMAGQQYNDLRGAGKPPLGWIWGDFYKPWQRIYPGATFFNQDINLRREYPPLSLLELQRLIDLGWLDPSLPIDLTALCNTRQYRCDPSLRQFGVQLTDEGASVFAAKVNLEVQWASETAIAAVERAGGVVTTAYYDPIALTAAVDPLKWFEKGEPIPRRHSPPADLIGYYTDARHRGYLASPPAVEAARSELALKIGYALPDRTDDAQHDMLAARKDPLQVFFGLAPGWVVNLADQTLLKPKNPRLLHYYSGRLDASKDS